MGLYNNAQIDQVQKELYTIIDSHNRLVEVVELQDQAISTIATEIQDLTAVLHLTILQNPSYTTTRLSRIENQLKHRMEIVVHTSSIISTSANVTGSSTQISTLPALGPSTPRTSMPSRNSVNSRYTRPVRSSINCSTTGT
jgi:hypothetical protein